MISLREANGWFQLAGLCVELLPMKRSAATPSRIAIALIGAAALAFLLWEPHLEGRNAHATVFEIYFKDPFLAYAYLASLPFFVGLQQAYKALGGVRRDGVTPETLMALRTIKKCALALIAFVAVSVLFMSAGDPDDRPAGVFMRLLVAGASTVVAVVAARFERVLRNPASREC